MSKSPKNTAKSVKAITTKKVGNVIVNRGKGLKPPKFTVAPAYKLSSVIEDIMDVGKIGGKAGAGLIVAAYNSKYFATKKHPTSGKPYNPLEDYFKAPSEDELDDNNKVIKPSRKSIQDYFLSSNSAKYKTTLAEFNRLTAKLAEAKDAKNAYDESDYRFKLEPYSSQVLSARGMLHRALSGLAHLYDAQVKSVQFGLNNAISIDCYPNKDGSKNKHTGLYKAAELVSKGNSFLTDKKWVKVRGTNTGAAAPAANSATIITPPAVDATTAKTVMASLAKLFDSDKFNPPIDAPIKKKDIVVDKNDQAEFAITCIERINPQDLRSPELRATLSQLFVNCAKLLKVRNVGEAQKTLNEQAITKAAA